MEFKKCKRCGCFFMSNNRHLGSKEFSTFSKQYNPLANVKL